MRPVADRIYFREKSGRETKSLYGAKDLMRVAAAAGRESALDSILELKAHMGQSIIGQERMIERLLIGLLANGNLLVEGLPGLAKTRAIKSLAKYLDAGLSRIQFTPDLLPSDITGSEMYYTSEGKGEFKFQPGPIFNNLILADEINRAPAKVQAALLEAMDETPGHSGRQDAQTAGSFPCHGHPEPDRAGGHLPSTRSANGPLSDARVRRISRRQIRAGHHAPGSR
jgi:MoxR-like ATPase